MKRWKRLLAVLLAMLMLSGTWNALAELELEIGQPEDGGFALDEYPALNKEPASPMDLDLPDLEQEAPIDADASLEASTEGSAEPIRKNDDSGFHIENNVLVEYTGPDVGVVIPDGVTTIGQKAFSRNERLNSVVIPDSVTRIEYHAFEYCTHLTRITFGNGLTYIGYGAFFECEGLDNVVIPDSVTDIDHFAFCICSSLTSIVIPSSVTHIGDSAFNCCRSLSKVKILAPNLVIESDVFGNCSDDLTYDIICYSNAIEAIPEYRRTLIHNRVTDPAVAPSYEAPGLTVGSHCADCGLVFDAQQTIPRIALTMDQLFLKVGEDSELSVISQGDRTVSWSSSDATVASVTDGRVTALKAGTCTITATLNDGRLTCDVTVTDPAAISKKSMALDLGKTGRLSVSGLAGRTVTWSSSNKKVATVKDGTVTAVKAGKCTITAQVKNGMNLTCKVTVKDPAKLSDRKLTLILGQTHKLKVNGLVGRTVTWSSSNKKVATVKGGMITTVRPGKCAITAQVKNGKKLTCKVTVKDGAELSPTSLYMSVGETRKLTISNLAGRKVNWSSSNNNVATVKKGTVTALREGYCTITAKVTGGRKLTCHVSVTDQAKLSTDSLKLSVVDARNIGLTGAENRKVTWSSSNPNVASIHEGDSTHAVIYGNSVGEATITAQIANGKTLYCQVTVVNPLTVYLNGIEYGSIYSDLNLTFVNNTNADIIYVELEIYQFNNRGDQLESPYSYYYINDDIKSHGEYACSFWVNRDTKSITYSIREITFYDGTKWKP